jgi:hypothetical protein
MSQSRDLFEKSKRINLLSKLKAEILDLKELSLEEKQRKIEWEAFHYLTELEIFNKEASFLVKDFVKTSAMKKYAATVSHLLDKDSLVLYVPILRILQTLHLQKKMITVNLTTKLYELLRIHVLRTRSLKKWKSLNVLKNKKVQLLSSLEEDALRSISIQILYYLVENKILERKVITEFGTDFYEILKLEEDFKKNFEFNEEIHIVYENLPMICAPSNWFFSLEKSKAVAGGFLTKENSFIKDNPTQKFKSKVTFRLAAVVNELQKFSFTSGKSESFLDFLNETDKYLNKKIISCKENSHNSFAELKYLSDYSALYEAKILEGHALYYPRQLDSRGRIYSLVGYGLIPAQNHLARNLIASSKLYAVGEKEMYYLAVSIASLLGQKGSYDNRYIWFLSTKENLLKEVSYERFESEFGFNGKVLYSLLRQLLEYKRLEALSSEKRFTDLLVEIDASSSGMQFISMFVNDEEGMKLTGLLSEDAISLYDYVAQACLEKTAEYSFFFKRDCLKKIIMTLPYGSTTYRHKALLLEYFEEYYLDSSFSVVKERILALNFWTKLERIELENLDFGIDKEATKLLKAHLERVVLILEEVMKEKLPFFTSLLNFLQEKDKGFAKKEQAYKVETPFLTYENNYFAQQSKRFYLYLYAKNEQGYKVPKRASMTVYDIDKKKIDKKKRKNAICANVVQGLGDAFTLHLLLEKSLKQTSGIFPIHDSVLLTLKDIDVVEKLVQEAYQEVYTYVRDKGYFKEIEVSQERYVVNSRRIFKF